MSGTGSKAYSGREIRGDEKLLEASTRDPTHDKVRQKDLTGKVDQDSRDPLDLLKHLPPN